MSIFKACDVRGVVGEEWDEATARRIGRSLGRMVRRRNAQPICLGGDFRRSTPPLKEALLAGLLEAGANVRDIGQAPTPVVYFAGRHLRCPNAAVVTASHNSGEYNGVKFMVNGQPAIPTLVQELQEGLDVEEPAVAPGQVEPVDILAAYEDRVLPDAASVARAGPAEPTRRLRVVLDTMGGAFTNLAPRVLAAAGCEVISLVSEIDADFGTRTPNPAVDANLDGLSRTVVSEGADLGVALDGDGDRAAFIDHSGRVVRPEQMAAVLIERCFPRPEVVYDLKCASVLEEAVRRAGGSSVMQPSGYGFIKTAMIERRADFGVEVSGHYFFKALEGGDDGLFVSLVAAGLLSRSGESLAEMVQPIGWPAITPDLRIPVEGDDEALLRQIAASCGGEVASLDGVRAQYADGWGLARRSITEPLITLRFEGRDRRHLHGVARRFLRGAPNLYELVKEKLDE